MQGTLLEAGDLQPPPSRVHNLFGYIAHMHMKINNNRNWLILSPNVSGTDNTHVKISEDGVITAHVFTSWHYA